MENPNRNLKFGNLKPEIGRSVVECEKWHPYGRGITPKPANGAQEWSWTPILQGPVSPCGLERKGPGSEWRGRTPVLRGTVRASGPERRGRTLVLRGTFAPAGRNGGAGPRYCEGPFARAGRRGSDP
jgi:hypothetical protein